MEGPSEKLPSTTTDVEDAIRDILQSNPEFGVKSVLKEMHLKGLEIDTKKARSIVSKLKADIKDKEVHGIMPRSEGDTQGKKFHSILSRSTAEIQDKGIHNIVSYSKADIQEESPEQPISIGTETSEAVCQHVDDVLCTMLKTPKEVVRNFQALTHVFNGFMGPYELNLACISRLVAQNPFYRRGDTTNTPLESCKLVTTLVMLLCSELSIKKIKTISSFLTRSSGGLDNLGLLPPNQGVLEAAVESAKKDMLRDRKCRALAAAMTDLYVYRIPFQRASIAHSFVLVLSIDKDDRLSAILYQAFGPPDIGYDLTSWCLGKNSCRRLSPERLVEFVGMYETFVRQPTWNQQSEALYHNLFACKLKMSRGYHISTHTRILVAEPTIRSIDIMKSFIQIK